jgi:hypothetical protein
MNEQSAPLHGRPNDPASDIVLPGVHDAANTASLRGQKAYVVLSGARLAALLIAAISGALIVASPYSHLMGWTVLVAFAIAGVAEMLLIAFQPERAWYSGRAIAESTKTLAWRFSVQGQPFGPTLSTVEAESLLRKRIAEVVDMGKDRIDVGMRPAVVTDSMRSLRSSDFETRRATYVRSRTMKQREWYSDRAKRNSTWATVWRFMLLTGEFGAVIAAAVTLGADRPFALAGVIAAMVAAGAAWLALKQYSQLASAYRVAAVELALQQEALGTVADEKWPQAVADAEEAISREHTMWLASRGRESLTRTRIRE